MVNISIMPSISLAIDQYLASFLFCLAVSSNGFITYFSCIIDTDSIPLYISISLPSSKVIL